MLFLCYFLPLSAIFGVVSHTNNLLFPSLVIKAGVKLGRVSGFSKPGFRVFGFFKKKKKKKWNLEKKKKSKFLGGVGWEGGVGVGAEPPPTPPSKKKKSSRPKQTPRQNWELFI